jgi:antibiotic biosynthesis monooxygenase (ABM) superfamily enzyme
MMVLQIYFEVAPEQAEAFEELYRSQYAPALRRQPGYLGSRLLRLFPAAVAAEIQASATEFNYQMELHFDTEQNRRRWAASDDHAVVWPLATSLAKTVAWRGYDVAALDQSNG